MTGLLRIRYTLRIVPWDTQLSVILLLPSALPVDSPNDWDWSQIRILLLREKSSQTARERRRRHEEAYSVVIREVIVCTAYQLLQLAFIISSSMLNHKVSKQYLTKQPRWSSDVIKAHHQEVLLLCTMTASFLLFFIYFSPLQLHLMQIQTCKLTLVCENSTAEYILHTDSSSLLIAAAVLQRL